ncbi:MAG: hypothetical protein A4E71_00121 [Smithella sp. PtaU1.Bin162]|nr:MAG: hypothetical protein A4E71_00121 [Smithella sp. PtaU1.Bin162]
MKAKEKAPAIGGNLAGDTKTYNDRIIHCDSNCVKFSFQNSEIKTFIDKNFNLWWVAADICRALGLSNTAEALRGLDDDEISNIRNSDIRNFAVPNRGLRIINEPGLYSLILRSNKPEAKEFKRWVTHEVLPAIRKQGFYIAPNLTQLDIAKARGFQLIREYINIPLSQYGAISKRTGLARTQGIFYFRSNSRCPEPVNKSLQMTFSFYEDVERLKGC